MREEFANRMYAEYLRQSYPPGTRIELSHMDDPYAVPSGTRGTVNSVDDAAQIWVAWDNGRSLALVPGVDTFRTLTQQEVAQEKDMTMEGMRL